MKMLLVFVGVLLVALLLAGCAGRVAAAARDDRAMASPSRESSAAPHAMIPVRATANATAPDRPAFPPGSRSTPGSIAASFRAGYAPLA